MVERRAHRTEPINWQRMLIAGLAVISGAVGFLVHWIPGIEAGSIQFISGTAWKVGAVLAIGWLASPQLERLGWQRIRGTMLIAVTIVIVLYAIRPKIGAIAAVLLVAGSTLVAAVGWMRRLLRSTSG